MRICLITPAPRGSRKGNRISATRWARILRGLGHRVDVLGRFDGGSYDACLALHARRSYASIRGFRDLYPDRFLILALTGTDLYGDIHTDRNAKASLELADRFVLLQPDGEGELPKRLRNRAKVIYQSCERPAAVAPRRGVFEVCVMGHLRPVKDPFRTEAASRLLPATSQIVVTHIGSALTERMAQRAVALSERNFRYEWRGEYPRWKALRVLGRSRLMVLTSKMEGGANVVSEALACGVPVISSRISGSIGMLGGDYPGYFPVGDTKALAQLLIRVEEDSSFYESLVAACSKQAWIVDPELERESWAKLLGEVEVKV